MHSATLSTSPRSRLAALSESQRTLSLFTPGIRDAVFRAWAGPDRDASGTATPALTRGSLSRIQSTFGSMRSGASSVASGSTGQDTHDSRPTVSSTYSMPAGLSLGAGRSRAGGMRKRKKRVVDLRKKTDSAESEIASGDAHIQMASTYVSETSSVMHEEREAGEVTTPPQSPISGLRYEGPHNSLEFGEPSRLVDNNNNTASTETLLPAAPFLSDPPKSSRSKSKQRAVYDDETIKPRSSSKRPPLSHNQIRQAQQSTSPLLRSLSFDKIAITSPPATDAESSGGILEQAWMMKMAQEIARKVQQEKDREGSSRDRSPLSRGSKAPTGGIWASEDELEAPPAYVA
jgi:distribution and morphology protein 34